MEQPADEHADQTQTDVASSSHDGVVAVAKDIVGEITNDDVPGLAAEVAYHAIFSIPALLVVLIALAAIMDNTADVEINNRLQTMITENAPDSTQTLLEDLVTKAVAQADGGTASIGLATALVIALWAGSNGTGALMKSFNRAYNTNEARSFPRKKGAAVLLTIMMGVVVNLAIALWVFGGHIGSWLAGEFSMGSTFDWVWTLSRIPIGVLVIVLMLGLLYYYGPTTDQQFRWVFPGAVFSTVAWGVLVFGFSFYVRFASPGSAYGVLGSVIVFLFFLYLTALIFLVGAELNAVLARRYDERYQRSLLVTADGVALENPGGAAVDPAAGRSAPRSLAIGAATTLGIVLASLIGRRKA